MAEGMLRGDFDGRGGIYTDFPTRIPDSARESDCAA